MMSSGGVPTTTRDGNGIDRVRWCADHGRPTIGRRESQRQWPQTHTQGGGGQDPPPARNRRRALACAQSRDRRHTVAARHPANRSRHRRFDDPQTDQVPAPTRVASLAHVAGLDPACSARSNVLTNQRPTGRPKPQQLAASFSPARHPSVTHRAAPAHQHPRVRPEARRQPRHSPEQVNGPSHALEPRTHPKTSRRHTTGRPFRVDRPPTASDVARRRSPGSCCRFADDPEATCEWRWVSAPALLRLRWRWCDARRDGAIALSACARSGMLTLRDQAIPATRRRLTAWGRGDGRQGPRSARW
jgi:hypothetical protein